ncbi:hypothetical protein [uncultured Tenacibaculum sp.]|uniref:hypothetical protein n=1 Tax=uncultured Tenacibaculum sp. TaxID=174713 RepID=UPI00260333CC|nr:hypothetical protein [uncultured Tenacibaculum sp.]
MSKPIKSNLFRFVTLRSPQLIDNKELGFISFPEDQGLSNKALTAIDGVTTEAARKTALLNAYKTDFRPFVSRLNVKNADSELYRFSLWLGRNKSSLSYVSITENLPKDGVSKRIENFESVLWDQLFYNIINKKSSSIREAIIQMLIGYRFVEKFKNFRPTIVPKEGSPVFSKEEKAEFVRRANASAIIPKGIVISGSNGIEASQPALSKDSQDYMQADLKVALAKYKIKKYEASLKELEQKEVLYKKVEKARYDAEVKTYEASIEQIQQEATPKIQTIVDSKTGFQKELKTYPELQLPKFEFLRGEEVVRGDDSTFSTETLALLKSDELKQYDTFGEVKRVLRDEIKKDYQFVYEKTPEEAKKVAIGGTTVTLGALKGAQLYSYVGAVIPSFVKGESSISMNLNVGYANAYVTNATYGLKKKNGGGAIANTKVREISKNKGLLSLSFFPDGQMLTSGEYIFEGELTLNNGVKLRFNSVLFIDTEKIVNFFFGIDYRFVGEYSGVATKVIENGGEGTGSGEGQVSEVSDGVLYGVSQLGIADFRRVEQEVCCYVPGEVSHIENIMAREYKERSTRNLTSSEQTTEKTTEREVENLTDTTSTERNELQSETSSIVNEDTATSFGANASVSGGFGGTTFSAGTNFNTSSSNSASNSNSQAQTYAQEVTERALERVVQKVSSKRTSRILKEFEENNTHGFDNRKGDEHVTGVYRWVDKIYKNKLINYGKRLMYEFALPEPAKFFIESYLEKKEKENKTPKGLIIPKEPVHPSQLTSFAINNARDLTEANYQFVASNYNAEIKAYPEENVSVSRSYSKMDLSLNNGRFSHSGHEKMNLPKGYKLKEFFGHFTNWQAHDIKGQYRAGYITIGGENFKFNASGNIREFRGGNLSSDVREKLEFAIVSWDVASYSFDIVAKCELTKEARQEWQNEAYKAIMDAYNERLQEYNDFIISQELGKEQTVKKKELSSQINRGIEKRELKRIAIDLIARAHNVVTFRDNYQGEGKISDSKHVARTQEFQEHSEVVKFFEQAFDWEIMAYTFYPYFYGNEDNWEANFEYNEGSDPIFQAFLQSGMARSVVPVRPGFEEAVNWYMKTGEAWYGQGMVTDVDDDLYISVAEEMQTIEGEVEGTWETRVPTALTVLQADSVVLNEGGLPCNSGCEGQGLFSSSSSKIGGSPDGVDFDIVGQTNNVA